MHVRLVMHVLPCRRLSFGSSVVQARIAAMKPQYFEYQIDRGVEWIRIYSPGIWRPVPEDAPVPDPLYASTYREWRRSYHFQVYWSEDGSYSHAQRLCVLSRVGVPRLANKRLSTPRNSCTIHGIRDARQCGRRVLGGIVGTGWGVAGTVTATIP